MRFIVLAVALAILSVAAGCTGSPPPGAAPTTSTPATGTNISIAAGSARIAQAGGNATVPIVIASAPHGLSGYNITVSVANPSVAEITAVAFPEWAEMTSSSAVPAGTVALQAVDFSQQVPQGVTNVTLATLTVTGRTPGTTDLAITARPGLGVQDSGGEPYGLAPVPGTIAVGA